MNRPTKIAILLGGTCLSVILVWLDWTSLAAKTTTWWYTLTEDPEKARAFLGSLGPLGAPVAFMGLQVLQVVLAPIPGELSGFVGGYLFGTLPGFLYSSIGLTAGSLINFSLARLLGRRYVRKWIRSSYLERFDAVARRQGLLVFFLFFVIPGFPKDYLCLFIGLTNLSLKAFVLMAAIGRMPGTLMLSLQGAQVFQKDYTTLIFLIVLSLAFVIPAYRFRERLYKWLDGSNDINHGGNRGQA
ncbi:MAG: TVP38/TMEM64 family protein [Thermodesulfobacteriota bacterium]|nr:TVP38/TMEM64 family protein [Thermodesulfobacteriota bacterium]